MEYESPAPSPVPSPPREPSPVPDTQEKESPKKQEEVSAKPPQNGEKHRKRRRKLVPKTFMDEEGYMGRLCWMLYSLEPPSDLWFVVVNLCCSFAVTEKVWESESTDASDAEPPPVKEPPKPSSPQVSYPQHRVSDQMIYSCFTVALLYSLICIKLLEYPSRSIGSENHFMQLLYFACFKPILAV